MVAVTEDILHQIHETNMLLNSNLLDAQQSVNKGNEVSKEILDNIVAFNIGTDKSLNEVKEQLTKQLKKLDQELKKELNVVSKTSLKAISNESDELKNATILFQNTLQNQMQKQQQKQDQQFQSIQVILNKNVNDQKELIKEIEKNILAKLEVSLQNQNKLSSMIGELKQSLKKVHEEQVKKVVEENLQLKKFQKKWYIATFILILLGYFFK
jgi:CHAT domain-containing protein